jgi:RimJ/RimL family protein N-acetyltransferase
MPPDLSGFPKRIEHNGSPVGSLRPLTRADVDDGALMQRLCDWRNRNNESFFTQSPVTLESTRHWLGTTILGAPDRVMFLICDAQGEPVGQCGVRNLCPQSAELDAVMRGERRGHGNLATFAERVLLAWLFETAGVEKIYTRIFTGNVPSMRLFVGLGMRIVRREAFAPVADGTTLRYEPADAGAPGAREVAYLEMLRTEFA